MNREIGTPRRRAADRMISRSLAVGRVAMTYDIQIVCRTENGSSTFHPSARSALKGRRGNLARFDRAQVGTVEPDSQVLFIMQVRHLLAYHVEAGKKH